MNTKCLLRAKAAITGNVDKENDVSDVDVLSLKDLHKDLMRSDSVLKTALGKDIFTGTELDAYATKSLEEKNMLKNSMLHHERNNLTDQTNKEFIDGLKEYIEYVEGEQAKAEAKNPL